MANKVFNIAKGRVVELYNRVENNDPATSALVVIALDTTGLESDATLLDKDDFSALVSGATNEATNTNYARAVLTDTQLAALPAPDDTNDRYAVALPAFSLGTSVAAGNAWSKLVVGYDADTGAGTDSNIIPLTMHDITVTPDGSTINFATGDFFWANDV